MPDYKKMYFHLFNSLTDILTALNQDDSDTAIELIKKAQCEAEDMYLTYEKSDPL